MITAYFPDPEIWEDGLKVKRGIDMVCMECGANAEKGYTTSVSDLGNCLLIVRKVPCYKCTEVIYTGEVIKRLEEIMERAKQFTQEISIVNYNSAA